MKSRSTCPAISLSLILCLIVGHAALAQPNRRQPIPAAAEVAAIKAKIAEVYREDYAKAKTTQQKTELAIKIRSEGERPGNPLVDRYALLMVARDISAGDWSVSKAKSSSAWRVE